MATGLARGAKARGKRIAFGDGRRIIWDQHSETVFRGNPNIARPGHERHRDLEWIPFYKGSRLYNRHDRENDRWVWNLEFQIQPGEVFFTDREKTGGQRHGTGFIIIEPEVPAWKTSSPNKDWGRSRYIEVARGLKADGFRIIQLTYPGIARPVMDGAERVKTADFRDALAIMASAALYIGPEGGLHHGAAAVGKRAVVIFGGFIPPSVTGYRTHTNLTGGVEACGSLHACPHCRAALDSITPEQVYDAARKLL